MYEIQAQLIEKFHSRQAHVAVIGLGYVGLPLAVAFAEAGYRVTGIDLDSNKVDAINRGESYIEDIPSERLAALVGEDARMRGCADARMRRHEEAKNGALPGFAESTSATVTLSPSHLGTQSPCHLANSPPPPTSPSWPGATPSRSVCRRR
jgi:hypothetical protein